MEALALLRDVSSAYRNLRTLQVDATLISESGDEDWTQRGESRVSFAYAAPDRIRFEQRGRNGITQVVDGEQWHTCFGGQIGPRPRYHVVPVSQMGNCLTCSTPRFRSEAATSRFCTRVSTNTSRRLRFCAKRTAVTLSPCAMNRTRA